MQAPDYFQTPFCPTQFNPDSSKTSPSNIGPASADHFIVEDLLDLSNDDDAVLPDAHFDSLPGNSTDSSTFTPVDSCNSTSFSGSDPNLITDFGCRNLSDAHFSSDLCVPYEELAELEWLSNFVEDSFSSDDLQKLQLISGMKAARSSEGSETQPEPYRNNPIFNPDMSVPAKARSKRSRGPPCNWTSRLLVLSPTTSSTDSDFVVPATANSCKRPGKVAPRKKEPGEGGGSGDGRKCLHCATDKTPQWRTGPLGPKTLCNACGVRYKSGRLVPEYRPAASPTFVLTKHSNSHRKVLELRRQKEMLRAQQQQQNQNMNVMFDVSSNGDDYLIHQHVGPDFRHLI